MLYLFRFGTRDRTINTAYYIAFTRVRSPNGENFHMEKYAEFCYIGNKKTLSFEFDYVRNCKLGDMISFNFMENRWYKIE